MARPREFEESEAIAKAAEVFWTHGFQDASLPDLLTGMGLTRGSLYKAFKDKKNLFLLVLDHYETKAVDRAVEMLNDADQPDGSQRIIILFQGVYDAVKRGEERGCLLCTAASGTEMLDADIGASVHRGLLKMQTGFYAALEASPAHVALSDQARRRLANVLLTQYVGLRMLARSRLSLGVLEQSAAGVGDILRV